MTAILQIPADVGSWCRHAAQILKSSSEALAVDIDLSRDSHDPDGFPVFLDNRVAARLRDNLVRIAEALDHLADHGEHGRPIERTDAEGEA